MNLRSNPTGAPTMRRLILATTFTICAIVLPAAAQQSSNRHMHGLMQIAQAKLCDGVKYSTCCTAGSKAGCVNNADDCKKLGGSVQTNPTMKGCSVVFPDYAGRVASPPPETDCAKLPGRNGAWTGTGAITRDKDKPQNCTQNYACSPGTLSAKEANCKPVVETSSPQSFTGTCVPNDPRDVSKGCSSCNVVTASASCHISFVRK
jgi:hypothetical protein